MCFGGGCWCGGDRVYHHVRPPRITLAARVHGSFELSPELHCPQQNTAHKATHHSRDCSLGWSHRCHLKAGLGLMGMRNSFMVDAAVVCCFVCSVLLRKGRGSSGNSTAQQQKQRWVTRPVYHPPASHVRLHAAQIVAWLCCSAVHDSHFRCTVSVHSICVLAMQACVLHASST
jgi:hypothetical protein